MKRVSRKDVLKAAARCAVLTGVVGVSAALSSREREFDCVDRCGKCPKLEDGVCSLGRA